MPHPVFVRPSWLGSPDDEANALQAIRGIACCDLWPGQTLYEQRAADTKCAAAPWSDLLEAREWTSLFLPEAALNAMSHRRR